MDYKVDDCWGFIALLKCNSIESLKEFKRVFSMRKTKGEWVNPSRFKVLRLQMFLQCLTITYFGLLLELRSDGRDTNEW